MSVTVITVIRYRDDRVVTNTDYPDMATAMQAIQELPVLDVGDNLIFGQTMTDDEIAKVVAYLEAKWKK